MVAGAAPEGPIAGLEQPYLGCREAEIAGQRGGHNIEQLGLEELLVHLVDGLVEELETPGALLRLLEQVDVSQGDGQLLGEHLQRPLFPSGQAALIIAGLEVEHAEDLAFEHDRYAEDSRIPGRIQRGDVEQRRLGEHHEAPLPDHPADDPVGRGDGYAFHGLGQVDGRPHGKDTPVLVEQNDRSRIHLQELHAAADDGVEHAWHVELADQFA